MYQLSIGEANRLHQNKFIPYQHELVAYNLVPPAAWFRLYDDRIVRLVCNSHGDYVDVAAPTRDYPVITASMIKNIYHPDLIRWWYFQVLSGYGTIYLANHDAVHDIHLSRRAHESIHRCRYVALFKNRPDGIRRIIWDSNGKVVEIDRIDDANLTPVDYANFRIAYFRFKYDHVVVENP